MYIKNYTATNFCVHFNHPPSLTLTLLTKLFLSTAVWLFAMASNRANRSEP